MERDSCPHCFRPSPLCLCASIKPFAIEPLIVLLVHPREFMKTIGTVRIVKLAVAECRMIRGHGKDFDTDSSLKEILDNPEYHPVILFPGPSSLNLSCASQNELAACLPANKRLAILVIDGTWSAAKNMIKNSERLSALPRISFEVTQASIYEIRTQPARYCLSTVEAVSVLIENLKVRKLCNPKPADGHLSLMESFKQMIASQHAFEANPQHRQAKRYRRKLILKQNKPKKDSDKAKCASSPSALLD